MVVSKHLPLCVRGGDGKRFVFCENWGLWAEKRVDRSEWCKVMFQSLSDLLFKKIWGKWVSNVVDQVAG